MPVPVKVTTARAPVEFVRAAPPPLLFSPPLVNQVPLYVILGSVSSIRVVPPCWALLNGALTTNTMSKRKKLRRRQIILSLLRNADASWAPNQHHGTRVRPVCEWEEREVTVWSRNSVLDAVNSGLVLVRVSPRHRCSHKNGLPMS